MNTREFVIDKLGGPSSLQDLGLPEGAVYAADTEDSPEEDVFLVVRWLDEQEGLGKNTRRPFDLWVYDKGGDFQRAAKIAKQAARELTDEALYPFATDDGFILDVQDLRTGAELQDPAWGALVIPQHMRAVASGT